MDKEIIIREKPDWVSWEDIKKCLYDSHAINRAAGINMTHYQWSNEKIRDFIGTNGVTLVALYNEKVVGTASIKEQTLSRWYVKGLCGYSCFAAVLPEYSGLGIYKQLDLKREEIAKERKYKVLYGDTHAKNKHRIEIAKKSKYKLVRYFISGNKDHYCVEIAKWLEGCPYSDFYCSYKFHVSKFKTLLRTKLLHR